jgi:hypothetical protein
MNSFSDKSTRQPLDYLQLKFQVTLGWKNGAWYQIEEKMFSCALNPDRLVGPLASYSNEFRDFFF